MLRTFRERRDQYLRSLERSVKRLQTNEAKLQNEVDRLERELAATKSRLTQTEIHTHQTSTLNGGAQLGNHWGDFDFSPEMSGYQAYRSPSNDSMGGGARSFASSATTLVWIESKNDQPSQMHVQSKHDLQIQLKQSNDVSGNGYSSGAHAVGRSITTYVSQLDAVVVAMEFVLK